MCPVWHSSCALPVGSACDKFSVCFAVIGALCSPASRGSQNCAFPHHLSDRVRLSSRGAGALMRKREKLRNARIAAVAPKVRGVRLGPPLWPGPKTHFARCWCALGVSRRLRIARRLYPQRWKPKGGQRYRNSLYTKTRC